VANAQPVCQQGTCGFACNTEHIACLGQCISSADGPCGVNLPANQWQLLTQDDTGHRNQATLFYDNAQGEYVLVGGKKAYGLPGPYDVLGLRLTDPRWRNLFPVGKESWGPEVGNVTFDGFPDESFHTADTQGVTRPNFARYGGMESYFQTARNAGTDTLLFYLWGYTFSYHAAQRTWEFLPVSNDPGGGPSDRGDHTVQRLLWSAMAFDETENKVLLSGGGNMLTDNGSPGTWIYDVQANVWRRVMGAEPPPRAYSPLVTDPDRRRALLFGGDQLDHLLADTWSFDFVNETWTQLTPGVTPLPRAGHSLLFLPTSRTVVMMGGYTYSSTHDYTASHYSPLPMELWRFDWEPARWSLIQHSEPAPNVPQSRSFSVAAVAGPGDVVVMNYKDGYLTSDEGSRTWAIRVDAAATDSAGTTAYGAAPGATTWRTGSFDPAWYNAPPDATAESFLTGVTANRWTRINAQNQPQDNHDWGTAAYDDVNGVLLRWSGGHSAYCGSDVLQYDVQTNKYSIGYAPEFPLEWDYANDGVPGQWTFKHRPFLGVHTYRMYAYAPEFQRMVIVKDGYTYFYDPVTREFDADVVYSAVGGNAYVTVLAAVPQGMVAWTPDGLWTLNANKTWTALPTTGAELPPLRPDHNTMVFDSARNRLLLFSSEEQGHGQVWSVDLAGASHAVTALSPVGQAGFASRFSRFEREAVYLPGRDVVLMLTHPQGGMPYNLGVYHAAENRWYAYDISLGDTEQEPERFFGVSTGVVYDAARDLVLAVDSWSNIFVLKLDEAAVGRTALSN